MIPLEWANTVQAPPGSLLCERSEMPVQARGLWIPQGYRTHTLSGTAKIISGELRRAKWRYLPGEMVLDAPGTIVPYENGSVLRDWIVYGPGTYVLLTASAGKPIVFGYGGTTRTLVRITPAQILAVLTGSAETKVENAPPLPHDADVMNYPQTFDAGDPKALR